MDFIGKKAVKRKWMDLRTDLEILEKFFNCMERNGENNGFCQTFKKRSFKDIISLAYLRKRRNIRNLYV